MNLQNLTYNVPEALYLAFLVILFLGLFFKLYQYRQATLFKYGSPNVINQVLTPRNQYIFWIKTASVCIAWILATFALMEPINYGEYPEEIRLHKRGEKSGEVRPPHEIVLLIDTSASMSVKDAPGGQERLVFAKEIADQLMSRLAGQRVSLYAFTSELFLLSPLTFDYLFLRLMLQQMQINEGGISGTNLAETLQQMEKEYFETSSSILKTVLLFTDGGDTKLDPSHKQEESTQKALIEKLVKKTKEKGISLYTVGIGSKKGEAVPGVLFEGKPVISAVNESILKEMAQIGGGRYFFANDDSVTHLADQLSDLLNGPLSTKEKKENKPAEASLFHALYYQIPLAGAILLLIGILFLPDTIIRHCKFLMLFAFFILPMEIKADKNTEMVEAKSYFDTQEYSQANQIYQRLLDHSSEPRERAVLLYDTGTVYLSNKQFTEAIATLTTVPLRDDPSPLLWYRVKYNLILSYLGKAESPLMKPSPAIELLKKALEEIDLAQQAHCALQLAEGTQPCSEDRDLEVLKAYIMQKLSRLLQQQTSKEQEQEALPTSQQMSQQKKEKSDDQKSRSEENAKAAESEEATHLLLEMNQLDTMQKGTQPMNKGAAKPMNKGEAKPW